MHFPSTSLVFANQTSREGAAQLIVTLSQQSSGQKKIRHALKNLFFVDPEQSILSILVELFKKEIDSPSKCFKLICHHLVTHARFVRTLNSVQQLLEKLETNIKSNKTPDHTDYCIRVYFFLGYRLRQYEDTFIKNLALFIPSSSDLQSTDKKKKIKKGKTNSSPKIITEILCLFSYLNQNQISKLLLDPLASQKLCDLFPNVDQLTQHRLLHFLSFAPDLNPQIKQFLMSLNSSTFDCLMGIRLVSKDITFTTKFINENKTSQLTNFLLSFATELFFEEQFIIDSVVHRYTPGLTSILTIINLVSNNPSFQMNESIHFSLLQQSKHLNESLASLALLALSFVSDDHEWLSDVLIFLLKVMPASTRSSICKIFFKIWAKAIPHDEINGDRIRRLIQIPLTMFPNDLSVPQLVSFNKSVVQSNAVDAYLSFYNSLITSNLNPEVALVLFVSIAPLFQHASEEVREKFLDLFQQFHDFADPLLLPLYQSILQVE